MTLAIATSRLSPPLLTLLVAGAAGCVAPARADPPPDAEDGPITASERRAVVDALSAALDRRYVFAAKAKAIGAALHGHVQHGDYDKLVTAQAFARTLTQDMVALVHDKHLEVRYVQQPLAPAGDRPSPALAAEEAADERYQNHGIFEVRRMRFNLGYLNLHAFGRPEPTADKLGAAMRLLHDTQGLIIDLRDCHGGDTDTVPLAASYLLPAGTHLIDMYTRAGDTTERIHARAALAGPRYAADKPVVVLIGEGTVSGCESFAYMMQAQKRATVIGAPSAGAAYFGDPQRLTDHFVAFVPIGRPIDPITHGDWEGTGVSPDVATPPARALELAERRTLQVLQPREPSRSRKDAMQKRIQELN